MSLLPYRLHSLSVSLPGVWALHNSRSVSCLPTAEFPISSPFGFGKGLVFSDHSFDKTRFEGVEVMALE
jgi:hypothetical protein